MSAEINQSKVVPKKRVVKAKKEPEIEDADLFTMKSDEIVKIDDKLFPLATPEEIAKFFEASNSEADEKPQQDESPKLNAKEEAKKAKEEAKAKAKADAIEAKAKAKAEANEAKAKAKEEAKKAKEEAQKKEKEETQAKKTLQSKQIVEQYGQRIMSTPCFLIQILFNHTIPANLIVVPTNLPDDYNGLTIIEAVIYNLFDVFVLQKSTLIRNRVFAFNEYIFKTVLKHLKVLESNDIKNKKEEDKINYKNALKNKEIAYIAIGNKAKEAKAKAKQDVDADLQANMVQRELDELIAPSKYAFKVNEIVIDDPDIEAKLNFNVEESFAQHFDIASAHIGNLNTHLLLDVVKFYFANGCSPSSKGCLNLIQIRDQGLLKNSSVLDKVILFINNVKTSM